MKKTIFSIKLMLLTILLSACTNNPFKEAETVGQQVYAIERTYNAILARVAETVVDVDVDPRVKIKLKAAEARLTPAVDGMSNAFINYNVVSAQLREGLSTEAKMAIAAENLSDWIERATASIAEMGALLGE